MWRMHLEHSMVRWSTLVRQKIASRQFLVQSLHLIPSRAQVLREHHVLHKFRYKLV
jgi:hypothetical protein